MVHRLAAHFSGFDSDGEVFFELALPGEIGKAAWTKTGFELCFFGLEIAGNQWPVGHVTYQLNVPTLGEHIASQWSRLGKRLTYQFKGSAEQRFEFQHAAATGFGLAHGGLGLSGLAQPKLSSAESTS